jgi:hypothetical protein
VKKMKLTKKVCNLLMKKENVYELLASAVDVILWIVSIPVVIAALPFVYVIDKIAGFFNYYNKTRNP